MAPVTKDAEPATQPLEGRTIAVLSSLLAGTYFGKLIAAVAEAVHSMGGKTLAIQTQNTSWVDPYRTGPGRVPQVAIDKIDGYAVIINSVPAEQLAELRAAGKPVVLISHDEPSFPCPVVKPDNRVGVREAVEHLIEHGHTRIAFVGDISQLDIRERYESYRSTLEQHGIDPDQSLFFRTSDNQDHGGRQAGRAMVAAGLPSTAVLTGTDYNAVGVMAALREAGYGVPRDQAVVSFDDMPGAELNSPSLSTVNQNFDGVGRYCVELLARQLNGEDVPPRHYSVKTTFIPRHSCGCVERARRLAQGPAGAQPAAEFVSRVKGAFGPIQAVAHTPAVASRPLSLAPLPDSGAPTLTPSRSPGELAQKIADFFLRAVNEELADLELLELNQLAEQLYGLDPSPRVFEILRFARRFARQLELGAPEGAVTRLGECLQQLSMGLAKAGIVAQAKLNDLVNDSIWNEHEIGMELLRSHEKDPRSLRWLTRTVAQIGALALWSEPVTRDELEIAGIFDRQQASEALLHERVPVRSFPPDIYLDRAYGEGPHNLLVLLPIRTTTVDWGFLLLVAPIESALVSQETYFQWSALLGQALDYEAVTKSVRQRNDDLAVSYRRERDLADTIRKSEERYALAAKAANDGLWDWDLSNGTIYYSSRWKQMLGYTEDAIGSSPEEWLSRTHPDDRTALMEAISQRRRSDKGPFEIEHRIRAADGAYRWVLCRGLGVPDDGRPAIRLVGSLTDITERKSLEDQLVHQALYDSLTGLPNRALFLDRLSQSIAYARRSPGYEYAVLYLDLDGFKVVNDSLGHLVGDKLLVKVAKRIAAHLREADTAARFGGDEFAVLLHHVPDFSAVERIVSRLQADLGEPYALDGHEVVVTASIGISSSSNSYDKPEDVIRDADIAMYRAKSAGRAGYTTFDSSMHAGAMSRLQTESALRQAIERNQLELHYQPIVALEDGTLQAMEVLVRWRHPARGLIAPAEFLPVAEESGLIVPMGRWIQTEACRQLAQWKARGVIAEELRASINLSNKEFWNPGLLEQVDGVLATTGVPPSWVSFEITEGVIMHNLEQALDVLAALHQRGFEIHIDDFGTGYSSLEALHKLPIDALKIDRSFVANLTGDKSHELVRTIIQLGRNLSVHVIAEGIEDPGQQHALRELGCALGQGYWFSMPVPAGRLGELLRTARALPATRTARVPDLAQNASGPATMPAKGGEGGSSASGGGRSSASAPTLVEDQPVLAEALAD